MTPEHEALREAIAKALSTVSMTIDQAEAVLAVLPQHAPAVLGILGTVHEGVYCACITAYDTHGLCRKPPTQSHPCRYMNPERTPVFVVSLGAAAKETDDAAEDPNYRPAPQMGHVERLGAAAKEADDE
jgi:hypothetical protein